ncbi:hypothetical protein [Paraburkholderia atlantica]|uniref:hypothetical protein n=1 Tax=Paraburkholderia atlantica TaxID=2654982 RepID=UPI003D1DD782
MRQAKEGQPRRRRITVMVGDPLFGQLEKQARRSGASVGALLAFFASMALDAHAARVHAAQAALAKRGEP